VSPSPIEKPLPPDFFITSAITYEHDNAPTVRTISNEQGHETVVTVDRLDVA
jgi:hypothetical protein